MSCPSCYKEGYNSFCKPCQKALFNGKQISHILPFESPKDSNLEMYREHASRLSISGAQVKYSLKLNGNRLELTDSGGEYILKPIPVARFQNLDETPENEHLCMQIARQVYKIKCPANAFMQFSDNAPAYLVKRFDVNANGNKSRQEDFASLAGKTPNESGDFKYDYTYEGIARLMFKHIPAYAVEVERFFRLILFNYIIGNGDAHLKNFSVQETSIGDFILSPAYDLLNTRLHLPNETDFALQLFDGEYSSEPYETNGFFTYSDFVEFGLRIKMREKRVISIINEMIGSLPEAINMINASYLKNESKSKLTRQISDYSVLRLEQFKV